MIKDANVAREEAVENLLKIPNGPLSKISVEIEAAIARGEFSIITLVRAKATVQDTIVDYLTSIGYSIGRRQVPTNGPCYDLELLIHW